MRNEDLGSRCQHVNITSEQVLVFEGDCSSNEIAYEGLQLLYICQTRLEYNHFSETDSSHLESRFST